MSHDLDRFTSLPGRPLIFGHRGVREPDLAENTLEAFGRAVAAKADGIELDVRLSADGVVVVMHDPTLSRTTLERDPRAVRHVTWADLQRVVQHGTTRICRLEDVLDYAGSVGLAVNVELKYDDVDRLALVRAVRRCLRRVNRPAVMLSSFDPRIVLWSRALLPHHMVGFLFEPDNRYLPWDAGAAIAHALHPNFTVVNRYAVHFAKQRRRLVNVWTMNEPAEMRRMQALRVDAIITDKPALARQVLVG